MSEQERERENKRESERETAVFKEPPQYSSIKTVTTIFTSTVIPVPIVLTTVPPKLPYISLQYSLKHLHTLTNKTASFENLTHTVFPVMSLSPVNLPNMTLPTALDLFLYWLSPVLG